jgi:DNA-binding LacI/PurR family transcriptional regulator
MGRRSAAILLDLVQGRGENRQVILSTTLRQGCSVRAL